MGGAWGGYILTRMGARDKFQKICRKTCMRFCAEFARLHSYAVFQFSNTMVGEGKGPTHKKWKNAQNDYGSPTPMRCHEIGYIYIWCSVAHPPPPPPVDGSWSPPPLWLWGCGGALLVSDAADFLWFLVPPPPLWMCGWVMVVVAVLEVCI